MVVQRDHKFEYADWDVDFLAQTLEVFPNEIEATASSSQVRSMIGARESIESITSTPIANYILENNLYLG